MLRTDAEGPWEMPNGDTTGERAANGDRDGEKLGGIIEDREASLIIGERRRDEKLGKVLATAGLGGTVFAPG